VKGIFSKKIKQGRLGLEISPYGIAVAKIEPCAPGSRPSVTCHYLEGTGDDVIEGLKQLVKQQSYAGLPSTIVLHPALYRLFFIERPEVPESEVGYAVKWRLKDHVDKPLAELLVDAFSVPEDAFRGSAKMVYAVAAERQLVQDLVSQVNRTGLVVDSVQIGELAMHNILKLIPDSEGSTALLRLRNSSGTIILSQASNLYLARKVETGLSMIEGVSKSVRDKMLDDMLLDIQRSLDYYESQLRKGVVRQFYVAPARQLAEESVHDYLQQQLNVNVSLLDMRQLFELPADLDIHTQSQCFVAIGAAINEVER
jgi:MSHA biogenesis protein MshI